jgi:hypothetical protein
LIINLYPPLVHRFLFLFLGRKNLGEAERASQKRVFQFIDPNHDKLAWMGLAGDLRAKEAQPEIVCSNPPIEQNPGLYFFGIRIHTVDREVASSSTSPMTTASSPLSL